MVGIRRGSIGFSLLAMLLTTTAARAQAIKGPESLSAGQRAAASADASPAQATELGEVVITAQRRAENIQSVPISIVAVSKETLAQANIRTVFDLVKLAPSVQIGTSPGTVGQRINIRGLGSFGNSAIEPSVAVFIDGVYIPRPSSLSSSLLDIESMEVLSGPQGTLFGRNASVGLVNIHTAAPTNSFSASAAVETATGARYRGEAILNVPLTSKIAFRGAALLEDFGGYWINDQTGKRYGGINTRAVRGAVKAELTDSLTWLGRADYTKYTGGETSNFRVIDSSVGPRRDQLNLVSGGVVNTDTFSEHDNQYNQQFNVNDHHWGLSSDLTYKLAGDYDLQMINSYREYVANEQDGDLNGFLVPAYGRNLFFRSKAQSHEIQFRSPQRALLGHRLDFVTGLYFFREDYTLDNHTNFLANFCTSIAARASAALVAPCLAGANRPATTADFDQLTKSYAAFGQARLAITDTVDLTIGLRDTDEKKHGHFVGTQLNPVGSLILANENSQLDYSDNRVTYRFNLTWRPIRDLMTFATYSTGFKSGGFNSSGAPAVLGSQRIFRPETVKNYELGFKWQTPDRFLTLNATAYEMKVNGFQERATNGTFSTIRNVGNIKNKGLEVMTTVRPRRNLSIDGGLSYLDSKFTSYVGAPAPIYIGGFQDLTGARPTYAPKFSGHVAAQLDGDFGSMVSLRWSLRSDLNFVSKQNINSVVDNSPLTVQKAYRLLSARATLYGPDDRWTLAVFGDNLTDTHYCTGMFYNGFANLLGLSYPGGTVTRCFVAPPRTVGVRLGVKF